MFPAQRIALLKKIVSEQKSVDIATLCSHLQVSDVTVRKYLDKLEQEGFLIKMHGGAMLADPSMTEGVASETPADRTVSNQDDKLMIADIAAAVVEDGDNIFLGSGSTCTILARKLYKKHNITVITNNLNAAPFLAPYVRKLCVLGGDVGFSEENQTLFTIGASVMDQLGRIYVNKAFFSADGVDIKAGVTVNDTDLANIMERVKVVSRQHILLSDYSKFGNIGLYRVAPLKDFDIFVSTPNIPKEYKTYFFDHDIKLITSYDI